MKRRLFNVLAVVSLMLGICGCACLVSDKPLNDEGAITGDIGEFPSGCKEVSVTVGHSFDDASLGRIHSNLHARGVASLDLEGTNVTDKAMQLVRQLNTLEWLNVADTRVTTAGIAQLRGMANLKAIIAPGSASDLANQRLRDELPSITITFLQ